MRILLSLIVCLILFPSSLQAQGELATESPCNYYASPTGLAGNSGTQASPITIDRFYTIVPAAQMPGKTLCLMDGTYQGAAFMIRPGDSGSGAPAGLSGTSAQRITIRALNDGGAVIDGQFARRTVYLQGNSWWYISGFNAKNSSAGVVLLDTGSNDNIVSRVVAWDGDIRKNVTMMGVIHAHRNLFEDVAAFGTARKHFVVFGNKSDTANSATGNIFRRCWGRWEGNLFVSDFDTNSPKMTATTTYGAKNVTFENCLLTHSSESMPETYTAWDETNKAVTSGIWLNVTGFSLTSADGIVNRDTANYCSQITVRGTLIYIPNEDGRGIPRGRSSTNHTVGPRLFAQSNGTPQSCVTISHLFAIIDPNHLGFSTHGTVELGSGGSGGGITSVSGSNISVVGNVAPTYAAAWTGSGRLFASSVAGLGVSPWAAPGASGASLCFRTVGGVTGTTPLWPWPMNDRIKAATNTAGAYNGPCSNCTGGRLARVLTDVTADIETLLGTISASCKTAASPFPIDPGPTTPVLTNFTGTDGALTDFTAVVGSGMVRSSNQAAPASAGTHTSKYNTNFNREQEAYFTITTLAAEGETIAYGVPFLGIDINNRVAVACKSIIGVDNDVCYMWRRLGGIYSEPIVVTTGGGGSLPLKLPPPKSSSLAVPPATKPIKPPFGTLVNTVFPIK